MRRLTVLFLFASIAVAEGPPRVARSPESMEPTEGAIKFSVVDSLLDKMAGSSLPVKGHLLIWFHEAGIPEHLKNKSYADLRGVAASISCVARDATRS
jgi:hypothetical protein